MSFFLFRVLHSSALPKATYVVGEAGRVTYCRRERTVGGNFMEYRSGVLLLASAWRESLFGDHVSEKTIRAAASARGAFDIEQLLRNGRERSAPLWREVRYLANLRT